MPVLNALSDKELDALIDIELEKRMPPGLRATSFEEYENLPLNRKLNLMTAGSILKSRTGAGPIGSFGQDVGIGLQKSLPFAETAALRIPELSYAMEPEGLAGSIGQGLGY